MKNIELDISCPVCATTVEVEKGMTCFECGFQIPIFSSLPNDIISSQVDRSMHVRIGYRKSIKLGLRKVDNYRKKIKSQQEIRRNQERKYTEFLSTYDNLVSKNETLKKQKDYGAGIEELEAMVAKMEQELADLNSRLPESKNYRTPNFTFHCEFNADKNGVNITVQDIIDPYKRITSEVVFAVAFSLNSISSFHNADLIIPTESKRIGFLEIGQELFFSLRQIPPQKYVDKEKYKIIHLIANSLSQYVLL